MQSAPRPPMVPGYVGCVVIRRDGSRYLARTMPDPLADRAVGGFLEGLVSTMAWLMIIGTVLIILIVVIYTLIDSL